MEDGRDGETFLSEYKFFMFINFDYYSPYMLYRTIAG